jgi:hypothetical protein
VYTGLLVLYAYSTSGPCATSASGGEFLLYS